MQISTETREPHDVARPIGNKVFGKNRDARYAPGIRASDIARILCKNESPDFPQAQKYPLKLK